MTAPMIERLAYLCAHRLMAMEPLESQAIPQMQFACAGKRRTVAVDRVATEIMAVFEGAEAAELESLMAKEVKGVTDVKRSDRSRS